MISNSGNSQTSRGSYTASIEYSMSFNTGRAKDYLSNGFLGGQFTFKNFVKNNVALGLTLGGNVLAKEDEKWLSELPNGAIYGPQARYLNYAPILANVSYYFNKGRSKVIPYIQANVGTYYIWQRLQLGVAQIDNDHWHFGFGPEAGVVINLGNTVGLTINGRYNYALSSGTNLRGEEDNDYSWINANIGLAYIR